MSPAPALIFCSCCQRIIEFRYGGPEGMTRGWRLHVRTSIQARV